MTKVWVIISTACESCGGKSAVHVLSHEPDEQLKNNCANSLGGMYCIRTDVMAAEIDGETVKTETR